MDPKDSIKIEDVMLEAIFLLIIIIVVSSEADYGVGNEVSHEVLGDS